MKSETMVAIHGRKYIVAGMTGGRLSVRTDAPWEDDKERWPTDAELSWLLNIQVRFFDAGGAPNEAIYAFSEEENR